MPDKDLPSFDVSDEDARSPSLLQSGRVATETIDLKTLITPELTTSGSFLVRAVEATSFGKLLQAIPLPAVVIDRSGTILYMNQAWQKITPDFRTVEGKSFVDLFPAPAHAGKIRALMSEIFATRQPRVAEALLGVDKSRLWGRMNFRSIRMGDQRAVLVLVEDLTLERKQRFLEKKYREELEKTVRLRTAELNRINERLRKEIAVRKAIEEELVESHDELEMRVQARTTELKLAIERLQAEIRIRQETEDALREVEARFRKLAEAAPFGLSVMNADLTFEYLNPKFTEMLGYTRDDVPTKEEWFLKAYPDAEYRKGVRALWYEDTWANIPVGEANPRVFTVRCKDGTDKIISFVHVILEEGKQILSYQDITTQAKIAQALKESEAKYRTLFATANDAIFLIRGGRLVECNTKTLEMFGGRKEDIVGQAIWDLSAKRQIDGSESRNRARELIRNTLDGEIQVFEWQHIRLDGTPFDAEVGLSRLELPGETVLLAIVRDITERKKVERERERLIAELTAARESLQFQATHDKLSGLWNRSAILDTLGKELARSVRSGKPVGLVLADIDYFKQINDEYGHLAGDAVLREVSEKLEASIRPYDYVGRYGGDEFVIVLPGCGPEEAHHMAERIRRLFSDNTLKTSEGDFRITMSFGVMATQGVSAGSVDSLIRSVDEALYRAKQGGRNRVCF